MPTAKVRNLSNKEVGEVTLSDAVFGVELNESLIHTAVTNYLANKRQGTSATKTRGNVSGSGKKLWKQKGTGRARIASLRSPLWKGGGNVHGPQPRDWSSQLPKKMRRGALRSALSERLREGNLIIVDEFVIDNPKTKDFINILTTMELADKKKQTKTLIVDSLDNANLILASRNVKKTKITNGYGLNIYDLLYHEKLLISKAALAELNHLLDPNREKGETAPEIVVETKSEDAPKAKKEAKPKKEKAKAEEPAVDKAPVAEAEETAAAEEPNTGEVATEATSETVSEETTTEETSATENTDEAAQ
jgi:large subunit ribosomal protein L4